MEKGILIGHLPSIPASVYKTAQYSWSWKDSNPEADWLCCNAVMGDVAVDGLSPVHLKYIPLNET